jgi:hypothetical protein
VHRKRNHDFVETLVYIGADHFNGQLCAVAYSGACMTKSTVISNKTIDLYSIDRSSLKPLSFSARILLRGTNLLESGRCVFRSHLSLIKQSILTNVTACELQCPIHSCVLSKTKSCLKV